MKRIVIYQKNDNFAVEFQDEDEANLEDFCKQLENIFASQTVTTLHFTTGSIIIRPNLISKIVITNIQTAPNFSKQEIVKKEIKKPQIEEEDMITEE